MGAQCGALFFLLIQHMLFNHVVLNPKFSCLLEMIQVQFFEFLGKKNGDILQ